MTIRDEFLKNQKILHLATLDSKGVLTVHGSGFGTKYGSGHFRLVFLPNLETLDSALNKIEEFMVQ